MNTNFEPFLSKYREHLLSEDALDQNFYYQAKLPTEMVDCELKIKEPMVIAGLPLFFQVFESCFGHQVENASHYFELEGQSVGAQNLKFELPFNVALNGERLALNLMQRMSSIATATNKLVCLVNEVNSHIKVLDTRKTLPLYRSLDKYSVRLGGGYNHRFNQLDVFMIKDNHKCFFGSVEKAINYFRSVGSFYQDIVLEVHDLNEIKEGQDFGVRHFMLDNFSPSDVVKASEFKKEHDTFEVSGGINEKTIQSYCVQGVDVISVGKITHGVASVDLSMKYAPKGK